MNDYEKNSNIARGYNNVCLGYTAIKLMEPPKPGMILASHANGHPYWRKPKKDMGRKLWECTVKDKK